jgi:hypothetical protein
LLRVAAGIAEDSGLEFAPAAEGVRIAGIVRRGLDLASGRFAVIENGHEFSLVPWRPVFERQIGREISGVMRSSGSISWTFGRERQGPEVGM